MENKDFKNIDATAKYSNFQVLNPDFVRCKCNILYTGRNRNYTDITKEALNKLIERKGYANIPIVGHIKTSNKTGKPIMGSHDRKIEITNDGIQEINECTAFGVIPLDANPRMEKIIDAHGIEKEYFTVDVILWEHFFPELMETAYSDEVYFNQSMEIRILDYEIQDQYTVINDFSLQALCMLGKYDGSHGNGDASDNSEPCFEDSRIRRFSLDEDKFKQNFELMLDKLKQYESATAVHDKETNNKPNKEEKVIMDFKKINDALSTAKIGESDVDKYRLLNVTDSKVFALDMEDYKPYGFDYAVTTEDDTENVVIDFDSKVEMSLSATDKITEENFEEFDMKSVIDYASNEKTKESTSLLEAEFNKKMEEMKTAYEDVSASYSVAMKKVEEYEAKENEAKAKAHREEVSALFEKYSEKLGKCAEFLVYKAKCNPDEVTLDEVSEKLTLMVGKFTMETNTKKNFSYNPTETGVAGRKNETIENKYGHLLDKYMK